MEEYHHQERVAMQSNVELAPATIVSIQHIRKNSRSSVETLKVQVYIVYGAMMSRELKLPYVGSRR